MLHLNGTLMFECCPQAVTVLKLNHESLIFLIAGSLETVTPAFNKTLFAATVLN